MSMPDLVSLKEHYGYFLRMWLLAASLILMHSTHNLYILAGCSSAIHAVSAAEAICGLNTYNNTFVYLKIYL